MLNPFSFLLATLRAILIVLSLLVYLVVFLLIILSIIKKTQQKAFKIRRSWINLCNFILGIKVSVSGEIPEDTTLFISNHRSFSDPIIICKYLDVFIIAKAEVANIPLIHTGAKLTGILYVQRNDKESRSAVRKEMVDTLKSGNNVLVFPEGTTNNALHTLPYKAGTFKEAAKNNIQIVPIALEYKRQKDMWFKSSLLRQFYRQFGAWQTDVKLVFGPAIKSSDGEFLREKTERWTNDQILRSHQTWNSYFNKKINSPQ